MDYKYKCTKCKTEEIVTKSMHDAARIEYCKKCGDPLKRVYNSVKIVTGDGRKQATED